VSLAGGVGASGDRYENHADQVADAVVAGKPAEGLLDTMAGGGGGAGVQQKAVQREDKPGSSADGEKKPDEAPDWRDAILDKREALSSSDAGASDAGRDGLWRRLTRERARALLRAARGGGKGPRCL